MVTAQTQYSLRNARSYFSEHLNVGDYYAEGQRVAGQWFGQGAHALGLSGQVGADAFIQLCENRHPGTSGPLTPRLNTVRTEEGKQVANRRVFYDFTFSPPKSVSLTAFLGGDSRILGAHRRAVEVALHEFESFAATRVRIGGACESRITGNMVAALFTHDTSRSLDPHLHTHTIVFNATRDPVENRWKALENSELLKARKFAENVYYHELARDLHQFGYRLRNRLQGDFEIEGISAELCTRFSKRHTQIDEGLKRLLSAKPELASADPMNLRRNLAVQDRARKQRDITRGDLDRLWNAQTTVEERAALKGLAESCPSPQPPLSVREAVEWAEEHLFDRHSVVQEHRLWQEALARGRGSGFTVGDLKDFTGQRGYLRHPERIGEVTLPHVLAREVAIVEVARQGIGACHPIVWEPQSWDPRLDGEQRQALGALLGSSDVLTVFRGGAGTGKSFVLRQLVDQVRVSGRPVVVLAPQRQQVVDMEKAGFPSPATVSQLLVRRDLPEGALLVVDEAGQVGGKQMLDLLELATERGARVILSGDTRQHGPVEASDALLAIERHSGVIPIQLHEIRRQDPAKARNREERARIRGYREAVELAAKGDLPGSYSRLEKLGAIRQCSPVEQAELLANEYLELRQKGASTVVVSQTWSEVHRLNERIRDALKGKGLLGASDSVVQALDRLDLTSAQKRDERFHPKDGIIVFNQRVRHAQPGARGKLSAILKDSVLVETGGKLVLVPNRFLDRISVCVPRALPLAQGDQLHLKANRKLDSGARVTNGELVTVDSVQLDGRIALTDGRILGPDFREFLPGYAVTSYGSQGKTVDHVLLSDSAIQPATTAEQWYVSISRGRKGIRIFTPDKEQLRSNILHSGHRPLAIEFARPLISRRLDPVLWRCLSSQLARFGQKALHHFRLVRFLHPKTHRTRHEHQRTRMLGV